MPDRVAVFGGGVGGLSAAHELARRDFVVDVYEASGVVGGKARSLGVPSTGTGGRPDLPAEHGFRFFPGFYKHLPETMREIHDGSETAFSRLVETKETLLARTGGEQNIITPNKFPTSLGQLIEAFNSFSLFYCDLGIPKAEVFHFIRKLIVMLVSCDERRFEEYENQSWFEYLDAGGQSDEFKRYLAVGLSRSLVALNASDLSSRTGGTILLQFLIDFTGGAPLDRVLDRPTNEAWLSPWFDQLDADPDVTFFFNSPLVRLEASGGRVAKAFIEVAGAEQEIVADHYIAALPVEKMQPLVGPLLGDAPQLGSIAALDTSWMTGVLFYLSRDIPIAEGHGNYLDADWALTSISQPQFWPTVHLPDFGDGTVQGVLSVIISNWDDPLFGGPHKAKDCTPAEVVDIVLDQLIDHLNKPGDPPVLEKTDVVKSFLAPCLSHDPAATPMWNNDEPLFINTKGSWNQRPEAVVEGLSNFYLAADYVRTFTDLATMESANEAARRAVNGILDRTGSIEPRCGIWPLDEPALLAGYRAMDRWLYTLGLDPFVPPLPPLPWPCL